MRWEVRLERWLGGPVWSLDLLSVHWEAGSEGTCCEESGRSVPAQIAPFGALCHLASTSVVPSTQNGAFPWRQAF